MRRVWAPGRLYLAGEESLTAVALDFLIDHQTQAPAPDLRTVLAAYTMPDHAILRVLGEHARVAVSDVVLEEDLRCWAQVRRVSPPTGAMHHKFLVCGLHALTGSWNFRGDEGCNAMVYLWGGQTTALRREFDRVWPHEAEPALDRASALALVQAARVAAGPSSFLDACDRFIATRGTLSTAQARAVRKLAPDAGRQAVAPAPGDDPGIGEW